MTKINKLHFNGADYDIGDVAIHDLTTKCSVASADEFRIADSEDGNAEKKVTMETLSYSLKIPQVELLVVGGGGGGGYAKTACSCSCGGGGGGGGSILHLEKYNLMPGATYDVKVGAGGATNTNGNPSSFGDIGAAGGGAGGYSLLDGKDGGNGGGAGGTGIASCCSAPGHGYSYGVVVGYPGGIHSNDAKGSGGGGAGGQGGTAKGGCGLEFDISGDSIYYSTGGSGASNGCQSLTPGGGAGGSCTCTPGNATTPGSGGGGGYQTGGFGADGVVVVRYPTDCCYKLNGGIKYIDGCYTVHYFSGDGEFGPNVIQPDAMINFLLVGGGGGGGATLTNNQASGGGGAGGIIYCKNYCLSCGTYNVVVGSGGLGMLADNYDSSDGGDSCFNGLIAEGGGGGGMCATGCCNGRDGGSGGGGAYKGIAGVGSQGCDGATTNTSGYGGGGGGAGGQGCDCACCSIGGIGIYSNIEGEIKGYAGGGGGGVCGNHSMRCNQGGYLYGGGLGVISNGSDCPDARYYGGGGGGVRKCTTSLRGGNGYQGVFIISYSCKANYSITGGDCCYECNGNCIHIFTSDGTLTVN